MKEAKEILQQVQELALEHAHVIDINMSLVRSGKAGDKIVDRLIQSHASLLELNKLADWILEI